MYILSPLPTNHNAIGEIHNILFNFLWDGKGDKIKRDIMISDYENGGLRMIDIKLFNKALKLSWIKKYLDTENHGKWKLLFDLQLRPFGGEAIFRGNLSKKDLAKYITISDAFTLEILQTFTDIRYEGSISSIEQFKAQSLWQNSLIRVGNRPICYRYSYSYSYSFSLGKSAQAGKGAMRLALYEAPTRETRPDHYTGNSVPYIDHGILRESKMYVI